jgi:hypothetical protein
MVTGTLVARPRHGIRNQTYNPGRGLAARQLATRAYPIKPPGVGGWPNVPRGPHKVGETFAEVNPYRFDPHAIIQADVPFADIQNAGRVPDFRDYRGTPRSSNIPRIVDTTDADNYWIPPTGPFGGSQVDPQTGEVVSTEEMQRRNRGMRPPDLINAKVLRAAMMPQGSAAAMTGVLANPIGGDGALPIGNAAEVALGGANIHAFANSGGSNAVAQNGGVDLAVLSRRPSIFEDHTPPDTPYETPSSTPSGSRRSSVSTAPDGYGTPRGQGPIETPVLNASNIPVAPPPPPPGSTPPAVIPFVSRTPQTTAPPSRRGSSTGPTADELTSGAGRLKPTSERVLKQLPPRELTPQEAMAAELKRRRRRIGDDEEPEEGSSTSSSPWSSTEELSPSEGALQRQQIRGRLPPKNDPQAGSHRPGSQAVPFYRQHPPPPIRTRTSTLPAEVIALNETARLRREGDRQAGVANTASTGNSSNSLPTAAHGYSGTTPASHSSPGIGRRPSNTPPAGNTRQQRALLQKAIQESVARGFT